MDLTRKRLLYKATHRGMKETDKIIGGYAKARLKHLTEDELNAFDRLLDESDNDILNWMTNQESVPARVNARLLRQISSFMDNP